MRAIRVLGGIKFTPAEEFPDNPELGRPVFKDGILYIYTEVAGILSWYPLTQPRANATQTVRGWMSPEDKTKLDGIEAGAQVNAGTNLDLTGTGNSKTLTSSTGSNVTIPVATTTNAGLMSTGDKSKLNGIEANATGDQTAAEIKAALLTVDGSGSGLDADLLDGKHASSFVEKSGSTMSGNLRFNSDAMVAEVAFENSSGAQYGFIEAGDYGVRIRSRGTPGGAVAGTLTVGSNGEISGDGSGLTGTASLRATGTTKADVGLGSVRNVASYSQDESNSRYLAPYAMGYTLKAAAEVGYTSTAKNGWYAHLRGGLGSANLTFDQAIAEAASRGVRLPTVEEIEAEVVKGTGGGFDSDQCWTCTAVPGMPGYVYTVRGDGAAGTRTPALTDGTATAMARYVANVDVPQITASLVSGLSDAATTSVATIRSGTTKANVGLGNVQNVNQTDASNLTSGTVANARLPTTATRWPTWSEVTSKPTTFAPSAHTHTLSNITDAGNLAALSTNASTSNYLRGDGKWVTPPNTNTTYSVISTAEIDAGTATTSRVISAARIKYILDKKADASHSHAAGDLPNASTSAKGVVQLSTSTTSTSTTLAATSSAVKSANDNANNRVAKAGDTMTGQLTVPSLQVTAGTGIALGTATPSNSYNINMNDSFSVNGTRAAIYSIANVLDGTLTAARTHYGIYNSLRNDYLSGDSYALTQRGAHNEVINGPSNDAAANINTATGSYNYVLNRANGPVGNAHGSFNYVLNSRAGATTANAYGSYNQVTASNGSSTNAYGVYAIVRTTGSGATISNGYMFYGTNSTVTGTFTNRYGVYIASGVNNYFAGGIQVGGTAAGGTSRAGLGVGVTPPGAGNLSVSGTITEAGSTLANKYAAKSHTHAYVPTSRTVNGKALSANISLTASDVGAAASSHNHSATNITSGTLAGARLPNATATVQGAVKVRLNGTTAYITTNGNNA